jgi:hypothetical protein
MSAAPQGHADPIGAQGPQGLYGTCSDCLRPYTADYQHWEQNSVKLCGAETRMENARLQCAEIKLERLEEELADYNLIRNEPVVIGRLAVIKLAQARVPPEAQIRVTHTHRELAYRKLNKNTLPGVHDHAGIAWIDRGTDGGPPSFDRETVLAYGIAWGEARASERKSDQ